MGCRVEAVERGKECVGRGRGGRKCGKGIGKGEERVGGCGTEASLKELTGRQGARKGRGGAGGKAGKEEGVAGRLHLTLNTLHLTLHTLHATLYTLHLTLHT